MEIAATGREFRALTGLRGFLALWVVVMHASIGMELRHFWPDERFGAPIANLIFSGVAAVDGFFILSGFVLSYVYARHFSWSDLSYAPRFLALRLARIYPVHVVILLAYVIVYLANIDWPAYECGNPHNRDAATCARFGLDRLAQSAVLINAWGIDPKIGWNLPAWSISSEWFLYIAFPLLVPLAARFNGIAAAAGALMLLGAMTVALPHFVPMFRGLGDDYGLMRAVPEFCTGLLLYRVWLAPWCSRLPWSKIAAATVVLAVSLLASNVAPAAAIFCLALLILALACSKTGVVTAALSSRPMHSLGQISYSLYMVNLFVLEYMALNERLFIKGNPLKHTWQGYATIVVACIASILVASLLYRFVEEPVRLWARRRLALEKPSAP